MRRGWVVLLAALQLLAARAAAGQTFVRLQVDNDAFVVGRIHDRDYTHGLELSVGRQRCDEKTCRARSLGLAHALFTPDIAAPLAPPFDRPYVGFIGLRGALERWEGQGAWRVDATAGLRGPAALGYSVQHVVHETLGFAQPVGWEAQLPTAPWFAARGVAAQWAEVGVARFGGWGGAEVGTMQGTARLALRASVGPDGRWMMPVASPGLRYGVAVEAGVRWYAWDNTLEGREPGTEVPGQEPWRRWIQLDQTLHWKEWAVTWAMSWQGRDFAAQRTTPTAGSIRIRFTPRPAVRGNTPKPWKPPSGE